MLNIKSILKFVVSSMEAGLDRFVIINDEHVIDSKTGIEFHLFDEDFKITHGDKVIATKQDFTEDEQNHVMTMKYNITDPELSKERKEKYPLELKARREHFADLFENPEPTIPTLVEEEGTVDYVG